MYILTQYGERLAKERGERRKVGEIWEYTEENYTFHNLVLSHSLKFTVVFQIHLLFICSNLWTTKHHYFPFCHLVEKIDCYFVVLKATFLRYFLYLTLEVPLAWPIVLLFDPQEALKNSWAPKNWCFWTVVLQKTAESPLDCKEIKLVNPRGNQSWIFIGRTDAEAETPIL